MIVIISQLRCFLTFAGQSFNILIVLRASGLKAILLHYYNHTYYYIITIIIIIIIITLLQLLYMIIITIIQQASCWV